MVRERTGGPPAVADRMLLGRGELGHRPPVVRTGVVGNEGRVVAEPAAAPRITRQLSLAAPFEQSLRAVPVRERDDADVGHPAIVLAADLVEQLREVLLVARALARVAGGAHARTAAEPVRLDAGVVRDRHAASRLPSGTRP